MSARTDEQPGSDELPDEDLRDIYGTAPVTQEQAVAAIGRKTSFYPWHHPVKQIVRVRQWARLTERLIRDRRYSIPKLRYFTLPGPDLLDVRVLAGVCRPLGVQIEYFGFDTGDKSEFRVTGDGDTRTGESINAASALRQAGHVTDDALILQDRLEDLAVENSLASTQLRQRSTFDVVNIDACDHLTYIPVGRSHNTFHALKALLAHQVRSETPWLLFITTRAEPGLLGDPGLELQSAVLQNIQLGGDFSIKLATCLGANINTLGSAVISAWGAGDLQFLKIYAVGLGKFLLQFFHMQPTRPANVELASSYAYRVHGQQPDMVALAFRIIPDPQRIYPPSVGGVAIFPGLEPVRASKVATQAAKLQDLDHALVNDAELRSEALSGTEALLGSANYDVDEWRIWLAQHVRRPIPLDAPS